VNQMGKEHRSWAPSEIDFRESIAAFRF
jgi:hypothetical protein